MIGHTIDNSLTRGNKAEIANWGMPDYSAGLSLSYTDLNSGFTAQYDGVLLCNFSGNGTVTVGTNTFTIKQNQANMQLKEIHLAKGDFFQTSGIVATYGGENKFFPLIAG